MSQPLASDVMDERYLPKLLVNTRKPFSSYKKQYAKNNLNNPAWTRNKNLVLTELTNSTKTDFINELAAITDIITTPFLETYLRKDNEIIPYQNLQDINPEEIDQFTEHKLDDLIWTYTDVKTHSRTINKLFTQEQRKQLRSLYKNTQQAREQSRNPLPIVHLGSTATQFIQDAEYGNQLAQAYSLRRAQENLEELANTFSKHKILAFTEVALFSTVRQYLREQPFSLQKTG